MTPLTDFRAPNRTHRSILTISNWDKTYILITEIIYTIK